MTNHQSSSTSSSPTSSRPSSSKMHRLIISITLLTSLLAGSTLSIPQQTQRKSQQQRDTSEDGARASGDQPAAVFQCPEQFGYYMDTRDCTKYYVCVFGEVLHESCTGGLRFSRELQTCDWPRNVECKQDNITATLTTPEPSNPPSQQSAEAQSLSDRNQNDQQPATGVEHQASSNEESARSPKGSQMVFADEGSDPQQPSFDETVSPVITPDGTIHLHDGAGGTFGLGRAPLDSAGQSVDVFVKPMTSLEPIISSSARQRQVGQQRASTAPATSSSNGRVLAQQQANTRQPPQLSAGDEASSTRDTASGQPPTTGGDEAESGEQPTESSDSFGVDNGAGESSSVESAPTGEREEFAAREGAEEAELESDAEDVSTPSSGYVPPFSVTQHGAGGGSSRQQLAADRLPTTIADKDGVSLDSGEDGIVASEGSGSGDGASSSAGDVSGSAHPAESQQVSPARDNDAQGRRDEEEEQQHKPRQSQRRQNQTQSLHPHLHQQQQQLQLQKGLPSAPNQPTVAGNNRQSRMSNFQQQQAQLQLLNKVADSTQKQVSRSFSPQGPKPATSGANPQYLHSVNFNDSSKMIRLQATSHQLMELPGLLDESSSMQNDAATSFPQQPQFPSPRSQSLLFTERPFGGENLSTPPDAERTMLDEAAVTRPSSSLAASARQRFLDTSLEPQQSFMAAPRRPRPPKRQQIPSGGTRLTLPPNSFRPTNFSSPSSSFRPHHSSTTPTTGLGPPAGLPLPESFLVSREPPTPFVESDALAGGPPMMMMRGPPGGWRPPTSQPRASTSPSAGFAISGTGPVPGSRRPNGASLTARHFSELAAGERSQGQQSHQHQPAADAQPSISASQLPAAMTAPRTTSQQQARQRALQLQPQPSLGSATTNAGSGSLLAPTPPTTTPTSTTTSATIATATSQPTSTGAAINLLAGAEQAANGASQQEQDPQLVANRYLNSAIDALEAGQPFGAVDYDFEILNDNLSDRRNPGSSSTTSAGLAQQQHRPTTSRVQSQRSQSTGTGGQGARARSQQVQRLQPAVGPQIANRSALLLFNPNKQMDSQSSAARGAAARLREEEAGGEEERVSLSNGQPVAGERPSALDQQQVRGGSGRGGGGQLAGRHSFASQPSKPLPSSSPVVLSSTASTGAQQPRPQEQQPTATRKPRPTNKKIVVDHEQALANNRASVEPAKRPEPLFATPQAIQTATKCDNRVCKLPDCKCGDTLVPGGLDPKAIPQVVLLTFDDAVNELNWEIYEELFTGRTNPNGCPILATFYVSHEWTDYGQVQTLYSRGHEIASHSVTHSFGEKFSKNQWFREVNGQREILNMYGGVKMNDVRGMRAPFLQIGGNKMFEMLYDANFTYDSSMPIFDNLPPMWPYTLDYQLSHECMITPCPTKSFPGVWEVGMTMWVDLRGGRCSMGDACSNPPDEDGVHEMLMKNFNRHYKSNRAPFGLFYHSAWFNTVHHRRGFLKFLSTVNAMSDVFFVTNWQMLQWMRKPTPLSEINSFEPWQCTAKSDRPPPCFNPSVCNVKSEHGTRFMKTCQPCPANHQYPWVGATGFKGKQASLSGSG